MTANDRFDYYQAGYKVPAAPVDSWRSYDVDNPDPGYFQFDWLSARHPDLYDCFARSTDGLVVQLRELVDLSGLVVCDVGAGTGKSAIGVAETAKEVLAVDAYASVVEFGEAAAQRAGRTNVTYKVGDRSHLPLEDESVDAVTSAWAELDYREAARVLKPSGWLITMGSPLEAIAGELGVVLAGEFSDLVSEPPLPEWFEANCPPVASDEQVPTEYGIEVVGGVRRVYDFTYVAPYESPAELSAIVGRIYGPRASQYIQERRQSTLTWRLRISYCQIVK